MKIKEKVRLYTWALKFIWNYKIYFIFSLIFMFIYHLLVLTFPYLLIHLITQYFTEETVESRVISIMLLNIIGVIISYIIYKTMEMHYVEKATRDVQWKVYSKTREFTFNYGNEHTRDSALTLLSNNVMSLYKMYSYVIPTILSISCRIFIYTGLSILLKSNILLIVILICFLFTIILDYVYQICIDKQSKLYTKAKMKYNQCAFESIEAKKDLGESAIFDWIKRKIVLLLSDKNKFEFNLIKVSYIKSFAIFLIKISCMIVFFYIVIQNKNIINIDIFSSAFVYLIIFLSLIDEISDASLFRGKIIYDIKVVHENIGKKGDSKIQKNYLNLNVNNPNIDIKNLSYFIHNKLILNKINLHIQYGEKVCIIGKSGSGKTTLLKLIRGLLEDFEGNILLNNQEILSFSNEELSEIMCLIFQDPYLFEETIFENLSLNTDNTNKRKIEKVLESLNLYDRILKLSKGIDTLYSKSDMRFSKGEIQRLSLARAFIKNRPIILLDEVSSNLDYDNEKKALSQLLNLPSTVIFNTHRTSVMEKMDRIIAIENGKIIFDGNYSKFSKQMGGIIYEGNK